MLCDVGISTDDWELKHPCGKLSTTHRRLGSLVSRVHTSSVEIIEINTASDHRISNGRWG
jgi:hypothetical protein